MSPIANDRATVVKIADLDQKIANHVIRMVDNGRTGASPTRRAGTVAVRASGRWPMMLKWPAP